MNSADALRLEASLKKQIDMFSNLRMDPDPKASLETVCHALVWACSLDEWHEKNAFAKNSTPGGRDAYRNMRDSDACGKYMLGIRYARNRSVHQFADVLKVVGGACFPISFAAPLFEILWRPIIELPTADPKYVSPTNEAAYRQHLEETPVRFALDALKHFFGQIRP